MSLIELLAEEIAEFLGISGETAIERLERELFDPGYNVGSAWRARSPRTREEIESFYRETDAFIFELSVDHQKTARRRLRQHMLETLKSSGATKVLDYGGGIGEDAIAFASAGMEVTYYDVEGLTSAFAKWRVERHGVKVNFISDTSECDDGAFDGLISIEVLEHAPEPMELVAEFGRLVHPGGIAIVTESFAAVEDTHLSHLPSNRRYGGRTGWLMSRAGFLRTTGVKEYPPVYRRERVTVAFQAKRLRQRSLDVAYVALRACRRAWLALRR